MPIRSPRSATTAALSLLALGLRCVRRHVRAADPGDGAAVRAVKAVVLANLADVPPIDAVAARAGVSPSRLRAAFPRLAGQPIATWVRQARLEFAAQLLADTTLSVGEIAARIGYRSPCNFTTAFRRHFGVAPTTRRAVRSADAEVAAGLHNAPGGTVPRLPR